jgi:hypothetical protein
MHMALGPFFPVRKSEAFRPKGRGFCLAAALRVRGASRSNLALRRDFLPQTLGPPKSYHRNVGRRFKTE